MYVQTELRPKSRSDDAVVGADDDRARWCLVADTKAFAECIKYS